MVEDDDCQSITYRTKVATALQHLEETDAFFPLGASAHVIDWDVRSSKAEMD